MYYVFQNTNEEGYYTYGFIPEDKIAEEVKQFAFKVLDALPEVGPELDGQNYALDYNEAEDIFFWVAAE